MWVTKKHLKEHIVELQFENYTLRNNVERLIKANRRVNMERNELVTQLDTKLKKASERKAKATKKKAAVKKK